MEILDGKVYAAAIKAEAKAKADEVKAKHKVTPGLAVVIVGSDPASKVYVASKAKACGELGLYSREIALPEETDEGEILKIIDELNRDEKIHGILVQLPLPKHLAEAEQRILTRIDPKKDVDGFHPVNMGKLVLGEPALTPCTPTGCIKMLKFAKIPIEGKRAVIIGRSNIVGKPMLHLLLRENATVTVCHSRTQNLGEIAREADILVAAVGKPHFVTADMVKPGATVIDVGINRLAPKKLTGDVDFESVKEIAGAITPVPGGVGLLTVATLMANVVEAAATIAASK